MAILKNLQQENEALKRKLEAIEREKAENFKMKVSDKGALSVYGLQRFPVTLYREQWETVLENANRIREFIKANSEDLKRKGE